jgi:hypothetical protein
MDSIIIYRDNREHGPYSVDEVRGYLASGHISEGDSARLSQDTNWRSVKELLASLLPPVPQSFPPPLGKGVAKGLDPISKKKSGCLQQGCVWWFVITVVVALGLVGLIILGSTDKDSSSNESSGKSDYELDQSAIKVNFTPISIVNNDEVICQVKTGEFDTKTIHISDIDTTNMADGNNYSVKVWRVGVYRYTTVLGGELQIESYTASRKEAKQSSQ